MSVADVEWFARNITAEELLEMSDADGIVETVGNWVVPLCQVAHCAVQN